MLFFFSNADFWFDIKKLISKFYIIAKTPSTISWVEFIDRKKFVNATSNKNLEIIVIDIAVLEAMKIAKIMMG